MSLDDARSWWNADDDAAHGAVPDEELLALVKRESEAFDETIRRRDRRESIAAVAVFAFFAFLLVDPSWLVRAGAVVAMAGAVLVYWTLRRTRKRHERRVRARSLARSIRAEREKVDAQIGLLERVLWWYIAPFVVAAVLIIVGSNGASWVTLVMVAIVVAVAAWIYRLNRNAVRCTLRPRRERLTRLLRQIEE